MIVIDVSFQGSSIGGFLVTDGAAMFLAGWLVHRAHVLLETRQMTQPCATYFTLHGIGLGARYIGMLQFMVLLEIGLRAQRLATLIADDGILRIMHILHMLLKLACRGHPTRNKIVNFLMAHT